MAREICFGTIYRRSRNIEERSVSSLLVPFAPRKFGPCKKIPTPAGMLVTPSDEIVGDGVGYLQLMKLQKK